MIEIFLLKEDKIERHEYSESLVLDLKGSIWIRCLEPSEKDIESLSLLTKIPPDEFKDTVEGDERSKVSVNKHIEIIYRTPAIFEDEVITIPLYIFAIGNIIATIERRPNKVLADLSKALIENKRKFLFKKPGGYFIFYVLDRINDEFLYFIDKISIKIDLFREKRALSKESIEKIYNTSITLSYFNQSLIANIEVLNELRKSYYKLFEQEDRRHFSELYYDALQILDTEKIQRELLTNLFNMHSTIVGNELNYFMKIVALVALLSTVPTLITNIFAMNVVKTPIVDHPYAFYIILGMIIFAALVSYFFFKYFERKW